MNLSVGNALNYARHIRWLTIIVGIVISAVTLGLSIGAGVLASQAAKNNRKEHANQADLKILKEKLTNAKKIQSQPGKNLNVTHIQRTVEDALDASLCTMDSFDAAPEATDFISKFGESDLHQSWKQFGVKFQCTGSTEAIFEALATIFVTNAQIMELDQIELKPITMHPASASKVAALVSFRALSKGATE